MKALLTNKLRKFGSIPLTGGTIAGLLADYDSPKDKVSYMVEHGELVRLKRGLYCVSTDITGKRFSSELIANHLYGPSYVSLETALAFYNLIPERMAATQSVVTKRAKLFQTPVGRFTYQTVPEEYYSVGIRQQQVESGVTFMIASPEKALCDLILLRSHLRITSEKAMRAFMEDYMRVDFSDIKNPDLGIIDACLATHHKVTELRCLRKVMEHDCV
jgi:phage terminase large subunit-like protein